MLALSLYEFTYKKIPIFVKKILLDALNKDYVKRSVVCRNVNNY